MRVTENDERNTPWECVDKSSAPWFSAESGDWHSVLKSISSSSSLPSYKSKLIKYESVDELIVQALNPHLVGLVGMYIFM